MTLVVTFHVLLLYNKMKRTLAQNNFKLMLVLSYLHFQALNKTRKMGLALLMRQEE